MKNTKQERERVRLAKKFIWDPSGKYMLPSSFLPWATAKRLPSESIPSIVVLFGYPNMYTNDDLRLLSGFATRVTKLHDNTKRSRFLANLIFIGRQKEPGIWIRKMMTWGLDRAMFAGTLEEALSFMEAHVTKTLTYTAPVWKSSKSLYMYNRASV